jgi:hypothetical protein
MFKNLVILFVFVVLSTSLKASESLVYENILFNRDNTEISGLDIVDNKLLMVGDKLSNRAIYKIWFEKNRFYYKNHIDFTKLQGHNKYFTSALLLKHGERLIKSPFDLEGITHCKETYYIVNEQVRHVLKITNNKLENLKIDFSPIFKKNKFPLKNISVNAGFEGVAVDCKKNKLYISQERSPRAVITVDLNSSKVTDMFLLDNGSSKSGSLDYAGLHIEGNFLYLLERNNHLISKYDLTTKKIISQIKFGDIAGMHLKELYDTGEPFGLAEGLAMNKEIIYIAIDNNKNPISKKGVKKFKIEGDFSSILIYKRPKDF